MKKLLVIALILAGAYGAYQWHRSQLIEQIDRTLGDTADGHFVPQVELPPREFAKSTSGSLSADMDYAVALKRNGTLFGWGNNALDQLGFGNPVVDVPSALQDGESLHWQKVYAGSASLYAIDDDGHLFRRANRRPRNAFTGEPKIRPRFRAIFGDLTWTRIQESQGRTLGLTSDGRLFAWSEETLNEGHIYLDNIGDLPFTSDGHFRDALTDEKIAEPLIAALAGQDEWKKDGLEKLRTHWSSTPEGIDGPEARKAFENLENYSVQLRNEEVQRWSQRRDALIPYRSRRMPVQAEPDTQWIDFCLANYGANSSERAFALDVSGKLWKGESDQRQGVAHIYGMPRFAFAPVVATALSQPTAPKFKRVFCSEKTSAVFALTSNGELWGFGRNEAGTLGDGHGEMSQNLPVEEAAIKRVNPMYWNSIAFGWTFVLGIAADGSLWGWGEHYGANLGTGDKASHHNKPRLIDARNHWLEAAAGKGFGAALNDRGQIVTWGQAERRALGVLGNPDAADRPSIPQPVKAISDWGRDVAQKPPG